MALCCDFRIMTDFGHIGLNEVALGIAVPECWGALMAQRIGAGAADKMLQFARLVSPQEALTLGLVDQVSEHVSFRQMPPIPPPLVCFL